MNESDRWYARTSAESWLRGVIEEGFRLVGRMEESADGLPRFARVDRGLEHVHEHLFVVAAHNLLAWIEYAVDVDALPEDILVLFASHAPVVRDMRNMLEHNVDYVQGKGRAQARYVYVSPDGRITADATGTIVMPGRYMIGGRLQVQAVMETAIRALEELQGLPPIDPHS